MSEASRLYAQPNIDVTAFNTRGSGEQRFP